MAVDNQGNPVDVDVDAFFPTSIEVVTEGPQGPPGPEGPAGTGASTYEHIQGVPTDTWVVDHALNKYPSVICFDSAGDEIEGLISYPNMMRTIITFSSATGGIAYLN